MTRRFPVIATIFVAAAVAVMIALGIWQLKRAGEKDRLIARYQAAENMPPIAWPATPLREDQLPLFRHATGLCPRVVAKRAVAGANMAGEPGYAHIVECAPTSPGPVMTVDLGWSKNPNARFDWPGGLVSGVIAPDRKNGIRLVAAGAPAGLQPSAQPSLATIPNNHRSYAVQWFAFAAIALVIFLLAVRGRRTAERRP
ncbi:MAG TPA: SURF1 family protein [Sphingomicrobium sp.]